MLFMTLLTVRGLVGPRNRARKLVGRSGEAMVSFHADGHVLIEGRRYRARTVEPVRSGELIEVLEVMEGVGAEAGARLKVRPIRES